VANRDWDSELDFTADELADMGAEILNRVARPTPVAPEPSARRRVALRVPGDDVPRTTPEPAGHGASADAAEPSDSDAVVEQAFDSPSQRNDDAIALDEADVIMDQAEALAPTPPPKPAAAPAPGRAADGANGRDRAAPAGGGDGAVPAAAAAFRRVDTVPEAAAAVLEAPPAAVEPEITIVEGEPEAVDAAALATVRLTAPAREAPAPTAPVPATVAPEATAPSEGAPAPAAEPANEEVEGELAAGDVEELPVASERAPAEGEAAAAEPPREVAFSAEMMAAMSARAAEDEGVELSGADLEEIQETPALPNPVAAPEGTPGRAAPPPTPARAETPIPRRRRKRPWFEEVFDEDYLRTLPFLTPAQTEKEAAFVQEGLQIQPGAHLLDLGCGYGRHAMELAARGFEVTGIDLSLALLIRAADEAQRRGLRVNFVHGDMRELNLEEPFDGAYSIGTSFGYFDDETNRKVAHGVAKALKPGARFLVDVINRDYVVADLPSRVWWEGDGCVVLEEVDFNYYNSRLVVRRSVVFEDGRQLEHDISIRVYSLHELGRVLQHAGFRVLDVSGHVATRGRYFGAASRSLLVVAERRSELQGE
jgi:SAM-dependent methyltransferase